MAKCEGMCVGLVSGHAYTLVQAKQTKDGHKLVELRNPWGDFEWNGDWSGAPHPTHLSTIHSQKPVTVCLCVVHRHFAAVDRRPEDRGRICC